MDLKLAVVILCLLAKAILTLTNPIKIITQPANRIDVDLRLQIYIIKVQIQSILGISRMQGGDHTVTLCKSELVDLTNPYFAWHDKVFEKGRKMTKEQFLKHKWSFNSSFKHFKFLKDDYDGYKIVPLPKIYNYASSGPHHETIKGVQTSISYKEQIEFVVLDLSTEVGSQQTSNYGLQVIKGTLFYLISAHVLDLPGSERTIYAFSKLKNKK